MEELALNNTTWDFQYGLKRETNKAIYEEVMSKVINVLVAEGMAVVDQTNYKTSDEQKNSRYILE